MPKVMEFDASFDDDCKPKYRYSLKRAWGCNLEKATIIMLNPSVADTLKNDLSINRCLNFCIDQNYGSLEVVNLFAFIETDSQKLKANDSFVGPENNSYLEKAVENAGKVIIAWGSDKKYRTRKRFVWNKFLSNKEIYYFKDKSNRTPPVHISRLTRDFHLDNYIPRFKSLIEKFAD